jgi:glucokinase
MSDKNIFAGIDIGGTNIKFGLFDKSGNIIHKGQKPTLAEKGPQPLMHLITNIGESLMLSAAEDELEIKHMGVGSPGAVDHKTGKVIGPCPNIKGWTGMEIGEILRERLNIPVFVDNEVNGMALGEYHYGSARGAKSVLCVTIGTGIGGAIIIDGKVLQGDTSSAGELGHMSIKYDGPECACGNKGCLEMYCSSKFMTNRAKTLLKKNMSPIFKEILDNDLENLTIKKLFSAAEKEDEIALQVIEEAAENLGFGLAGVINIINPEIVVLGGGITDGGAGFVELVEKTIKELSFSSAVEKIKVVKAALGNDAGFIGAGLLGEQN